jgi:fucose permease
MSTLLAGQAASMFWAALTVGRVLLGFVANYVRTPALLRGTALGAMAGTALLLANLSPVANVAAMALMGLAMAPTFPLLSAQTPDRVGAAHTANAVGFQIAGGSLGGALLPALAGGLSASLGLEIVAVLMLLTMAAFVVVQEITLRRVAIKQPAVHPHPST